MSDFFVSVRPLGLCCSPHQGLLTRIRFHGGKKNTQRELSGVELCDVLFLFDFCISADSPLRDRK